jgi:hypothetical protein
MADGEQKQENFHRGSVLTHSKDEPNNCPGGHFVEVHGFSSSPEVVGLKRPTGGIISMM